MATPLRKEHPEFDDEQEITTADLAQGKRPVSETRGPQEITTERNIEQGSRTDNAATLTANASREADSKAVGSTPLFPSEELESLRARWKEIQTAFVDEPRKAVEQADGLVASAMQRLAEVFAEERSRLEQQWDRGDSVSTEALRVALQRYRAFFDRLLSV
ncbi:MAG TPA: hypothetical protein VJP02_05230 [Candidatus Sulfotelmatobacter sp.]|nr:hypothetical protein [Candidatus Sulfotelmatobacter sp.]